LDQAFWGIVGGPGLPAKTGKVSGQQNERLFGTSQTTRSLIIVIEENERGPPRLSVELLSTIEKSSFHV
jgi:hypothetical protein